MKRNKDLWKRRAPSIFEREIAETLNCEGNRFCLEDPSRLNTSLGYSYTTWQHTTGMLVSLKNALASEKLVNTCGNRHANWTHLVDHDFPSTHEGEIFFMQVPMGYLFQHLLDGGLPKLMQWGDEISLFQSNLTVFASRSNYLCQDLETPCPATSLEPIVADVVHYSCYTPPLHPYLWRRM